MVEATMTFGGVLYGEATAVDFISAFDHVVALLDDAVVLFERSFFKTSAFLAISLPGPKKAAERCKFHTVNGEDSAAARLFK